MSLQKRLLGSALSAALALITPSFPKSQTASSNREVLTNQDVIELFKAGLSSEVITEKIKSSRCNFDTSPVALKELKSANVPDSIILAMVQAPVAAKSAPASHSNVYDSRAPVIPHKDINAASATHSNTVKALAYRVIPQQNTAYYQSGTNSSSTSCYGQGQFYSFGNSGTMNMNMNCDTTYTSPTQIPITWKFADVYVVVEGSDQLYLISCRANWRWSNCSPLIVGEEFPIELSGGTMKVTGSKNGKKEVHAKYNILQVSPKS